MATSDLLVAEAAVLIVDDDTKLLRSFELLGRSSAYEVVGRNNGVEGLRALGEREWDLLLVDVAMPEMGGLEFLRKAKERGLLHRAKAVRVMTGRGRGTADAKVLATEGYEVFEKGDIDPEAIERLLRDPQATVRGRTSVEGLDQRVKKAALRREIARFEDSVVRVVEARDANEELTVDETEVPGDVKKELDRVWDVVAELGALPEERSVGRQGRLIGQWGLESTIIQVSGWGIVLLVIAILGLCTVARMDAAACAVLGVTALGMLTFFFFIDRAEERRLWWVTMALYGAATGLLYEVALLLEAMAKGSRP